MWPTQKAALLISDVLNKEKREETYLNVKKTESYWLKTWKGSFCNSLGDMHSKYVIR